MFYKIYEIIYSEILLNKITSPLDVDELIKEGSCITFVVAAAAIEKSGHLLGQLGFVQ